MAVNGIGFSGGYYYNRMTNVNKADARDEKDQAAPESLTKSLEDKGQITLDSLKRPFEDRGLVERNMKITENLYKEALPEKNQGAPYSYLANEDGVIEYNGVVFTCDEKTNSICLGDMTDEKNVLNIPLSGGGHLKVNRNSIGLLSKAAGMFSPEDMNLIMRAITQDAKIESVKKEIEDEEASVGNQLRPEDGAKAEDGAETEEE